MVNRFFVKTPSNIITTPLNINEEYRKNCINKLYEIGDHQNNQTNVQAIMTSYNIWTHTNFFDNLLDKIVKTIDVVWPIKDERYEYGLYDAWGAIYQKGSYTDPHYHFPHVISFVYYLQATHSTPIIFNDSDFELFPTNDLLIIFPSYILHSVPKHKEEEDRICLAGNLKYIER